MKFDALLGCVHGSTSMSVATFQVVLVYNLHIHGTSSYNIHCNITRDNFQNNHEDKKPKSHMTRNKETNTLTNKMTITHSSIHFNIRKHLPTT